MKRFLIAVLCLAAIGAGCYILIFRSGVSLGIGRREETVADFRALGSELQKRDGDGYTGITVRGVEVSPAIPGHLFSEYAADEEDYLR
jgi:hypothetical protein